MIYPKIELAQSIILTCEARGIRNIVISPGSRNAPLTIGFVNNPAFRCYSIADERCAAFFALGIAQQIGEPVAVVCTSGSALLNYYPAVAEAFYSQIPVIVISADRPKEKIDIGDGQTIRQENVFVNHALFSANLQAEASEENNKLMNDAITASIIHKGPVHINAPFEEPLYETVEVPSVSVEKVELPQWQAGDVDFEELAAIWNTSERKMILAGVNNPGVLSDDIVSAIGREQSVIVLTETTSNLHHETFINNIDTIITPFEEADYRSFQPDLLITFGGMVVSKRIKAMLRTYPPKYHWHIDTLRAYDTFGALTHHIHTDPQTFFEGLLKVGVFVESTYRDLGAKIRNYRAVKHAAYTSSLPFCDFLVFIKAIAALPGNSMLHIGNSSPIRYAQLTDIAADIDVFCNRGTSGIDGSTSTAIGAAVGSGKLTTLITGDVSFLYDSNALWNKYIPKNFKIIVINNGGGGIFRILPGHSETPVFNEFFETSHCFTAEKLAAMYGFRYITASDDTALETGLNALYSDDSQPGILEVFTPTKENDRILLQYFKELA
jgi:2-succinyl-5-enolpyruvyl-6-hydroxy-3-cyclohexene-1-carboxylate synthase